MEARFESQIEGVLTAAKELQGYSERIAARSKKLEEFDELAKKALEERELRYEELKAWKPGLVLSTPARGWLRSKPKSSLVPTPTETTMVDAYNLADMEVRRCLSTADTARCSFKDKAIAEVDVISIAYQVAINAITKCLRFFAEDQQECASNASAGAGSIIKVACDTFGSRVAGIFQETLASEAQDISTASIPYDDLESISRYPTIDSQPIIVGFSLPPYYFSCTANTKFVVNVFCQLVSFVHDNQAWDQYVTPPIPVDYSLAPTFRELERSWTRDEALNEALLRSLGVSMCADLIKTLLASFPEPLIDYSEVPDGNLRLWNADIGQCPNTTCGGPVNQDSGMALVPLVPPLYNRPQGEMLRALCVSLIPVFNQESQVRQNLFGEIISDLLTRKGDYMKHAFQMLVRGFSTIARYPDRGNAPLRATRVTQISPASTPRRAPSPLPAAHCAPQSVTQAKTTAVGVEPEPDEILSNEPINDFIRPSHTTPTSGHNLTINDVKILKHGIVKMPTNKANGSYTILLVGETGVGKTSLVKLIANVLLGNDSDHYDLDILLKKRGTVGQILSPHLYEITSVNGTRFRILDTPGLVGNGGIRQDETRKEDIVRYIEQHVDFIDAVLILASGTTLGITTSVDYTFYALSVLFPNTLVKNIAFVFTSTPSPLLRNVSVPEALKNAPMFCLENPIVPRKGGKDHPHVRELVKVWEQGALEMFVKLFDWLDSLQSQPATGIVCLHETQQNIEAMTNEILDTGAQEVDTRAEIDRLIIALKKHSTDMDAFSNFEKIVAIPDLKQPPTTTLKIENHTMKKKWDETKDGKERIAALIAVNEMVQLDLKRIIDSATNDLVQSVEHYACLSSAGSSSARMRGEIKSLEAMDKKKLLFFYREGYQKGLDQKKRQLELLNKVEDALKGVSG